MAHQLTQLPSGVTVVTEAMTSVRSVTLGIWVRVGSRDEAPEQAGCAHFLEHLLFKGTTRRTARDIAEELDAVGGELNAFTSKEHTCFHARVLDSDVPLAMDVLADMIVDARNAEEDVEAERDVVRSELDIYYDTPDDLVHTDFATAVFGPHPLASETLGSIASVSSLSRETIDGFYREHYRPENIVVSAAGAIDHDALVRLAETLLGDLGRPGGGPNPRTPPTAYGRGEIVVRPRPTEQAHVILGAPGVSRTDPDRWALRVLDGALGGGMSSRLFQTIREERSLAYSTYSYAASYADTGLFGAYVGTSPAKLDDACAVLRDELDRVGDDVTRAEVERSKGALAGQTVLALEDTASRMMRIGRQVAAAEPVVTVEDALRYVDAVDVDAARAVAVRLLQAPRDLAVVGPFDGDVQDRFRAVVT
ncbi:MAG: pitrilysin family protein [Nitriliruptoraceae bacterium]